MSRQNLSLPMGERKLAGIAVADIGRTALGILKRGDEFIGRTVGVAGEHLTGEDFAAAFSESYGEPVAYRPLTFDEFRAQEIPAAAEMGNMFQYYYLADPISGALRAPHPDSRGLRAGHQPVSRRGSGA
jgi:uncharacterized protein YbjT (DUF2867 family)